jgi:predicted RecB family endonuclease
VTQNDRLAAAGFDSRRVIRRRARRPAYEHLSRTKLRVIDYCFEELGSRTFADLGGIWAVDGGYARYAAEVQRAARGVVVDDDFTDAYLDAERRLPNLTHIRADFAKREVAGSLGDVDVVMLFDVLLHQVSPDWDELLAIYAPLCRRVAIVQPQWNGPETVRLLELGEDEYLRAIPRAEPGHGDIYDGLFARLDELNARRGRPWRDVHDIWQWGITDDALTRRMAELGFGLRAFENGGPWHGLDRFHESAFVFDRDTPACG